MNPILADWVGPETAALIVVDVQNDFISSDGLFAKAGNDVTGYQRMVHERLVAFLEEARKIGMRVIFIQTENNRWTISKTYLGKTRRSRAPYTEREVSPDQPAYVCQAGSWGAEFYAIQPQGPKETVVKKHRYSAFLDTNLNMLLRAQGIETVILTGVASNVCVESTARDGFMLDYRVVFLEDCTASRSAEQHKATLVNMDKFFGYVVNSEEVVQAWREVAARVSARP